MGQLGSFSSVLHSFCRASSDSLIFIPFSSRNFTVETQDLTHFLHSNRYFLLMVNLQIHLFVFLTHSCSIFMNQVKVLTVYLFTICLVFCILVLSPPPAPTFLISVKPVVKDYIACIYGACFRCLTDFMTFVISLDLHILKKKGHKDIKCLLLRLSEEILSLLLGTVQCVQGHHCHHHTAICTWLFNVCSSGCDETKQN